MSKSYVPAKNSPIRGSSWPKILILWQLFIFSHHFLKACKHTLSYEKGNITINNSTNKGKDILSFDENDYSKGSFSTAKSGRDLVLTYTESDESIYTQNITIKNYFSKDGRSTSSLIYGYKLGETVQTYKQIGDTNYWYREL